MQIIVKKKPPLLDFFSKLFLSKPSAVEIHQIIDFTSKALARKVRIDIYRPTSAHPVPSGGFPTLFINDGQDMEAVGLKATLEKFFHQKTIPPIVAVAIHAGDRMHEYGTSNRLDYKKRGKKAKAYARFLLNELIPFLKERYPCSLIPEETAVAGFSLGGLSAFDLAWHQPRQFLKVGVFSGSFWWRHKAFTPKDPDADRVIHDMLAKSEKREGLRFWLQTGTKDETEDRNNNGIIDAIDDTLDVIKALKKLGYQEGHDITYVEVIDGEHNPQTWGKVMPDFLKWAFRT
jgi:enterochelin esterase-like enzyme